MHLVADTLIATLEKVFLNRLAHLQQHALQIDLMARLDLGHGQLHDHHLIAIGIVLDRPLAKNLRRCVREYLNLPTCRPRDAWLVC